MAIDSSSNNCTQTESLHYCVRCYCDNKWRIRQREDILRKGFEGYFPAADSTVRWYSLYVRSSYSRLLGSRGHQCTGKYDIMYFLSVHVAVYRVDCIQHYGEETKQGTVEPAFTRDIFQWKYTMIRVSLDCVSGITSNVSPRAARSAR